MRCVLLKLLGLASLASLGVPYAAAEKPDHVWLTWHFTGTTAIKANADAVTVKEIFSLPETRRLGDVLADRLSQAPERQIFGNKAAAPTVRRRIIKGFVEGFLSLESFGTLAGTPGEHPNLSVGIKLPDKRVDDWIRNLSRYLGTLGWKSPEQNPENEAPDWTATHQKSNLLARLVKQGDWLLFSVGPDGFSQVPQWNNAIAEGKVPTLDAGAALSFEGDLERLAQWLGATSLPSLPQFRASFKPEENGVRTEATVHLNKPIRTPLPKWAPPGDLIFEPIVSFSGARGLKDVIESMPFSKPLANQGLPEQFFSWSRPAILGTNSIPLFPLYLSWPVPHESINIGQLTKDLPKILGPDILQSGSARLHSFPERNETMLQVLPSFIQPFVRGATNHNHGVRIAGLFPLSVSKRTAPKTLLDQLDSQENIVYYHWEITQRRIETHKTLIRLLSFIFQKPQSGSNSVGFRWLNAIEPKMGNAVTIVTAPDLQRLEIIRKSHFGFTGLELVAIARWLEAESFPWVDKALLSTWKMRSFLPMPAAPTVPTTPTSNAKTRR